ncbi:hypothetical protein [Mesorhizobium sp. M7A.F.Ca.ET.027.03.2.1]|uniref:hypothetical protein n=1 Tax=Mesorhizobium sp. M7A.F.Ca.ET.027.03.2.1 TaxID=2496656 RepID=UPI0016783B98|nr:hypothetical protein [Mesorhizobium sp. M7A.F.Ca.ET.027.03.2.1]
MSNADYARQPKKHFTGASAPYAAAEFAEKYGLTLRSAQILLFVNGPSRVACDAAARAFNEAVAMRNRQRQTANPATPVEKEDALQGRVVHQGLIASDC